MPSETLVLPERRDIAPELTWRLTDLYPSVEAFEEDLKRSDQAIAALKARQGTLGQGPGQLLAALQESDALGQLLERIYAYAHLQKDQDATDAAAQAMAERADALAVRVSEAASFVDPEILGIAPEQLASWVAGSAELGLYAHFLDRIGRRREHTLSADQEALVAQAGHLTQAPASIFRMINEADLRLGEVQDEAGNRVELTKGRFLRFLESPERRVREEAYHTMYAAYRGLQNTLAATYGASVRADMYYAQVHRYGSSMEAALATSDIPPAVYDQLIESVHRHLPTLHRYMALRKKVLGLQELHMYDLYVPLVPDADRRIPYEQAKELVVAALAVHGSDYQDALRHGLAARWIDVAENRGKRGGAYSWGVHGVHPYVLLNYQDSVNSLFTLAHEMGHAMHSHYTMAAQPYVYSDYTIFLAEVASTCHEALLLDHLLRTWRDQKSQRFLLNHQLESFRTTLFRQAMFAEFERKVHAQAEAGGALTTEWLTDTYRELNELYYGPEVVVDEDTGLEWARIPHFYTAFYVYKYATGFSAATALAQQLLHQGEPAVRRYRGFLEAGGSDYPIETLRRAGVDMTTKEPVEQAMGVFARTLDQLSATFS